MNLNVAIIGPGRSKQGTGPYIARTFNELGANICGLISSSLTSANKVTQYLQTEYKIACNAYENIQELLEATPVDVIVISSPIDSHFEYLKLAVQQKCHIFCEKPLWWPDINNNSQINTEYISNQTINLVNQCIDNDLVLQLNTQWPFTLPTYYEIYPQQKLTAESIKNFSMWLSPQSIDGDMIIDAVPHVLSMLYSILSTGKIENIESNKISDSTIKKAIIEFDYIHAFGDTRVVINLTSSDAIPKPAAYAINHNRVDRHVEPSNYLISLCSPEKKLPVMDPLVCSIKNFISSIYSKTKSDEVALIDGMHHLAQIYQAVTQK